MSFRIWLTVGEITNSKKEKSFGDNQGKKNIWPQILVPLGNFIVCQWTWNSMLGVPTRTIHNGNLISGMLSKETDRNSKTFILTQLEYQDYISTLLERVSSGARLEHFTSKWYFKVSKDSYLTPSNIWHDDLYAYRTNENRIWMMEKRNS